jgi:hypothetical protein
MSLFELKRMVEINIQQIKQNVEFNESIFFDESELVREFKSICHNRKLHEEIQQWQTLLKKINQQIYQDCQHEFITDYIDLNLDRSQQINYCQNCGLEAEDSL